MIEPVSFTSTFRVNSGRHNFKSQKRFRQFQSFSDSMTRCFPETKSDFNFKSEDKYPYYFKGYILLSVPNDLDDIVEGFCERNEVKYKKFNH